MGEPTLEFSTVVPKTICPQCGYESPPGGTISISIEPYSGDYCCSCWAKWIYDNIAKMIPKSEHEDNIAKVILKNRHEDKNNARV